MQALAEGRVYNAVDGCKKLGIGGDTMDKQWAAAKKAGHLVKFGGGFYAGKTPLLLLLLLLLLLAPRAPQLSLP